MLEAQNRRREARTRLLLALYLPQLILLVFHIVDEDFLMSTHVLHNEVVVRG